MNSLRKYLDKNIASNLDLDSHDMNFIAETLKSLVFGFEKFKHSGRWTYYQGYYYLTVDGKCTGDYFNNDELFTKFIDELYAG